MMDALVGEEVGGEMQVAFAHAPNACSHILPMLSPPTFIFPNLSTFSHQFLDKLPGANRLSVMRSLAISPDMFEEFPYDWQQLASLVLVRGGAV